MRARLAARCACSRARRHKSWCPKVSLQSETVDGRLSGHILCHIVRALCTHNLGGARAPFQRSTAHLAARHCQDNTYPSFASMSAAAPIMDAHSVS